MKKIKLLTLCIIVKDGRILLGMKKRGFGEGRWNGFGGKVEPGETIAHAAHREVQEEVGITVQKMDEVGVLMFEFESDPQKVMEVHVFKAEEYIGEATETEEMRPQWFDVNQIPYEQMWSDDAYWLPLLLQGKKFTGTFLFDRPSDATYQAQILRQELKVQS
ncbi:MAG: 8-oxo-dGTP diphosphatase [Candidatus Taylorbacteria bacterium]